MDYCKQFIYVMEIVNTGSFSVAAENLKISQPALSKYIKNIEDELKTELFNRTTSPVSLTEAGRCYVETARNILDANRQFTKRMNEIKQIQEQEIRVGISPSRAPYLIPEIMTGFHHEQIKVVIMEATTAELNEKLSAGELDLIISVDGPGTEGFERKFLFTEKILLAKPKNENPGVFISSGKGQPVWKLQNILGMTESTIECQNMITAVKLVEAGVGYALVPSYMESLGNENIEFQELEEISNIHPSRKVFLFYRNKQYLSDSEIKFMKQTIRAVGENKEEN